MTDPQGPENGIYRVIRGGSWNFFALYCRSALRSNDSPVNTNSDVGFRLARSVALGP